MLVHAVRALSQARTVDVVVVAAPPSEVAAVRGMLDSYEVPAEVQVVAGGATRRESVGLALDALAADVDVVLVHDAARPLAPSELADAVAAAVRSGYDAVVPALHLVDTVKQVGPDEVVLSTVDRRTLRAVQTPQGFRRSILVDAHTLADGVDVTDDAGLVEAIGHPVLVVPGHPEAFKVTTPLDLVLAEAVLAQRRLDHVR
jgi:2-C-methyl-D-erythritol 4-phosphate cytidylyltransferase